VIVATAGHVDHGKTSLVKSLTGIDTDRLEEEKRRGLSINLGFAYRQLQDGVSIGFIDVPGHHRFVNTMIAGVNGIDLGMLVVAADDGMMPQTHEHLDVLRLLGVERFVLVVSKTDRVAAERVDEVAQAALSLLPADTPAFAVSNVTGAGIEQLMEWLDAAAGDYLTKAASGGFQMPLDRAFNVRGSGLVVTGTVAAGRVAVGDTLLLQPRGERVRVRGIHAQDKAATSGCRGQRCALNISGELSREQVERGDWLVAEGSGAPTGRFDARFTLLESAGFAVKHLSPVRLHLGARRVPARLYLIERGADNARLAPGKSALVQMIIDAPVIARHGDRFILRDDSETVTLGGGRVLDPFAPRSRKQSAQRIAWLRALEIDEPVARLRAVAVEQDRVVDWSALAASWNLRRDEAESLLQAESLNGLRRIAADDRELLINDEYWQRLLSILRSGLARWHEQHPDETGLQPARLRNALSAQLEADLFLPLVAALVERGDLVLDDGLLRIAGHEVALPEGERRAWQQVEPIIRGRGRQIPLVSELLTETGLERELLGRTLRRACKDGRLVRVNETRYALPDEMLTLADTARELAGADSGLTVIGYRDAIGVGRKLAIEILEHFDELRFTRRDDQLRVLLDPDLPERVYGARDPG
jgi:selenocysteine-specific elongation factor